MGPILMKSTIPGIVQAKANHFKHAPYPLALG